MNFLWFMDWLFCGKNRMKKRKLICKCGRIRGMNYRIKIAEHPEYADALVAMFGTDDIGRISEQDARLFWHYVVPQFQDGHFKGSKERT